MARYKLSNTNDYLEALSFISSARDNNREIELKYYHPNRTNKQNNYYHFVCAYFAHCYGCSQYEAENVYMKQYAAPHIFEVEFKDKNGRKIHYYRSSAELNTAEMASAINNFLAYADCNGIPIPHENDELNRRFCEQQLEKSNGFR